MEELKIKKGIFHSSASVSTVRKLCNTPSQSNISLTILNAPNKILAGQYSTAYVNQVSTDISIG